jgi:hypothetical protein
VQKQIENKKNEIKNKEKEIIQIKERISAMEKEETELNNILKKVTEEKQTK